MNFSRTVLDHLPLPRNDLQRLGDVLAQLAQPRAATAKANSRARLDHPLTRQMLGEGLARRTLAGERHHIDGLGHGPLGGDLVLSGRTLELLERQLHLIEQTHRAFRALAIELARQLCNLQLLMGDHGLIVRGFGLGRRQFRLDPGCPGRFLDALRALRDQRRPQRGDVVGEVLGRCRHGPIIPHRRGRGLLNHKVSQSVAAPDQVRSRLSAGRLRAPGAHWVPPIDPVEHVGQLRRTDRDDPVGRRRPDEPAALQPLGVERHADAVMPNDLN